MPLLEASDLCVSYRSSDRGGSYHALHGVDVTIDSGSFVSIIGPSGSGKSTLLRTIGGLIPYTSGTLLLDGHCIVGPGTERGLVFQSPRLLPWRTVLRNVSLGMEVRREPTRVRETRARALIALVGLAGREESFPGALSGGMQQRVNLARALALDPDVLLLDEPFSALDALTRESLGDELLKIWTDTHKTTVFVTHDIQEAVYLSDTVHLLSKGPRSRIAHTVQVPLPRPRDNSTRVAPEFINLVTELREKILSSDTSDTTSVGGCDDA